VILKKKKFLILLEEDPLENFIDNQSWNLGYTDKYKFKFTAEVGFSRDQKKYWIWRINDSSMSCHFETCLFLVLVIFIVSNSEVTPIFLEDVFVIFFLLKTFNILIYSFFFFTWTKFCTKYKKYIWVDC